MYKNFLSSNRACNWCGYLCTCTVCYSSGVRREPHICIEIFLCASISGLFVFQLLIYLHNSTLAFISGYSPSTKLVPSVIDPRLSSTASLPLQVTAIEKCSLCGLVEVQALGAYCPSCRAYLARLNPLTSSIRSRKTS